MKQAGSGPQVMGPEKNGTEHGAIAFKTFDAFEIFFMEPVDAKSVGRETIGWRYFEAPFIVKGAKLSAKC